MDVDIQDFKAAYQRMCKDQHIEVQDCILKQLEVYAYHIIYYF